MNTGSGVIFPENNECPICHAKKRDGMIFFEDGSELGTLKCNSCGQSDVKPEAGKFKGIPGGE